MFIRSQSEYQLLEQQSKLIHIAKVFRKNPTAAEQKLWMHHDQSRDEFLKEYGYTILRFKNEEVLGDLQNVLSKIEHIIPLLKKERDAPS